MHSWIMSGQHDLAQILYISTVCPGESANLPAILAAARRNNARDGITGLLMFNGKRFLQVLEGPAEVVEQTFERIRRDSRHRAQVVLSRKRIDRREFGRWSIAFHNGSASEPGMRRGDISALTSAAHPNLRAELMAFAQQL